MIHSGLWFAHHCTVSVDINKTSHTQQVWDSAMYKDTGPVMYILQSTVGGDWKEDRNGFWCGRNQPSSASIQHFICICSRYVFIIFSIYFVEGYNGWNVAAHKLSLHAVKPSNVICCCIFLGKGRIGKTTEIVHCNWIWQARYVSACIRQSNGSLMPSS